MHTQLTSLPRRLIFQSFKRNIVLPSRATSVRDKDLTEDLWTDWYKQNKWKQTLGSRGFDDLDKSFLQQDFLSGVDVQSKVGDEDFEEFTKDIIGKDMFVNASIAQISAQRSTIANL